MATARGATRGPVAHALGITGARIGDLGAFDLGTVLPVGVLPGPEATPHLVETTRLAPCFRSVADARDFSRRVVGRWQVPAVGEDLAAVVSELVANALDHGLGLDVDHPAAAAADDGPSGPAIELRLLRTPDRVVCLVSDPAPQPPRRLRPDAVRESGRGLHLIDSLSQDWGWAPLAAGCGGGKVVWAALAAPAEAGPVGPPG